MQSILFVFYQFQHTSKIIFTFLGGCSMLEQYETILIPEEVCEILRIGQNEVYKMLKNKEICGYKVGKTWRIPKENVIHYIKSKIRSRE